MDEIPIFRDTVIITRFLNQLDSSLIVNQLLTVDWILNHYWQDSPIKGIAP